VRIEEQTVRGYRTCGRDRRAFGDCPGYSSEEIDVIREVTTVTFGDLHENTSDPYWPITSHEHVRLRPAHEADRECPHCGAATSISLEPRHEFPRLSEHSPNELVRRAELERARDERSAGGAGRRGAPSDRAGEARGQHDGHQRGPRAARGTGEAARADGQRERARGGEFFAPGANKSADRGRAHSEGAFAAAT
jgi:hypothetical protein